MGTKKTIDCLGVLLYAAIHAFFDLNAVGEMFDRRAEEAEKNDDEQAYEAAFAQYRRDRKAIVSGLMKIASGNPVFQHFENEFGDFQRDRYGSAVASDSINEVMRDLFGTDYGDARNEETVTERELRLHDEARKATTARTADLDIDKSPIYDSLAEGLVDDLVQGWRKGVTKFYVVLGDDSLKAMNGEIVAEFANDPSLVANFTKVARLDSIATSFSFPNEFLVPCEIDGEESLRNLLLPNTRRHVHAQMRLVQQERERYAERGEVLHNTVLRVGKNTGKEVSPDGKVFIEEGVERVGPSSLLDILNALSGRGGSESIGDSATGDDFSQRLNAYFEDRGVADCICATVADSRQPFRLEGKTYFQYPDFEHWYKGATGNALDKREFIAEANRRGVEMITLIEPISSRVVKALCLTKLPVG